MRLAVVLLLVAACGRVDFDSTTDAAPLLYPEAVLASDPFVYYRLDETKDDAMAADASGHGRQRSFFTTNDGVAERGAMGALKFPNEPGTSLHIEGTGNDGPGDEGYVDFPEPEDDPAWADLWDSDWTIELFFQLIQAPSTRAYALVLCEDYHAPEDPPPPGSGFRTGISSANTLRFWNTEASGDTDIAGDSLDLNRWYHLAVVHRGMSVSFYIDGVDRTPADNAVLDYVPPQLGSECGFGSFHGMPSHMFFDELALYDHALSASEVAAHFTSSGW